MDRKTKRTQLRIKPVINSIAAFLVFGGMAFLSGPLFVFKPQPGVVVVENFADLDSVLREREAKVPGLKSHLAKGIVWFDGVKRTKLSVVVLHGFSASRKEMSPVFETLGQRLGANVFFTRLKAHGLKDGEAFADVSPQDWIHDAREALAIGRRLGERVLVVGMSTGALLAIQLALENVEASDLAGLVLISPNFQPSDSRARFLSGPLGRVWARVFIGFRRSFSPDNDMHADYWTSTYRSEGLVALMDLVNAATHFDLSRIDKPLLVLYTKKDKVVSVPLIEARFREFGSERKQLVNLPEATRHEFASEALAPEAVGATVDKLVEFVRGL